MRVTVSSTFPGAIRGEIEALVRAGLEGLEHRDVEVHVKARRRVRRTYVARYEGPLPRVERDLRRRGRTIGGDGRRSPRRPDGDGLVRVRELHRRRRDAEAVARRYGGRVEVATSRHPRAGSWSGRTYDGVPGMGRVRAGTRYLVTMVIPADPRRLTRYPLEHRDPRLKTSPLVRFGSWQEQLVHLAAHEARHVHQFRHGLSRSERDAEVWAAERLEAFRSPGGTEAPEHAPGSGDGGRGGDPGDPGARAPTLPLVWP